jgi:hypothetical protein
MSDQSDEIREEYCSECGCVSDDEVCPKCAADIVDAQHRLGEHYRGDRRWNGQAMSHRRRDLDFGVLVDVRED